MGARFGAIGAAIGSSKGSTFEGLILGALLGIIGIIILLFMKPRNKTPPWAQGTSTTIVGWHPDPFNRFQLRYYDGAKWTAHVSSNGLPSVDEPPANAAAWVAPPSPQPAFTRPVASDPILTTQPKRKWDKATRQWLVASPTGQWVPEDVALSNQPVDPPQGTP